MSNSKKPIYAIAYRRDSESLYGEDFGYCGHHVNGVFKPSKFYTLRDAKRALTKYGTTENLSRSIVKFA